MKGTHQHALNPHKYTPLLTVKVPSDLVCFSLSVDYFFDPNYLPRVYKGESGNGTKTDKICCEKRKK